MKPEKCCEMGTYGHQVCMPINGKVRCVDYCISHMVAALNAANITTANSCCGHGRINPSIILEDDRFLVIMSREEYNELFVKPDAKEKSSPAKDEAYKLVREIEFALSQPEVEETRLVLEQALKTWREKAGEANE